jgi:CheY-like chemotaxis protein
MNNLNIPDEKVILIVDDDEDDLFLIREALLEIGIGNPILEASNGDQVLRLMESHQLHPAVILMDMNMPLKNGLETVRALRQSSLFDDVPAIILTTGADPHLAKQAFEAGAASFYNKPFTFEGFIELAHQLKRRFPDLV